METIERLMRDAREKGAEERRPAVAKLGELAKEGSLKRQAIEALMKLLDYRLISGDAFAPCAGTVLEMCGQAIERAVPFQQEVIRVEWLVEFDYEPISMEARRLLDVLGHLSGEEVLGTLRDALTLADPYLRCAAVVSLLLRGQTVGEGDVEAVAACRLTRVTLWEKLRELGMESLMPLRWRANDVLAASDLTRWLAHSSELGEPPEEIELMKRFRIRDDDGQLDDAFLFRFRTFPKPWEPGEGWMAGMAGPYRDGVALDSPWSCFKHWDSMSPDEHFHMEYYRGEEPEGPGGKTR
jgi:hypothetical protein